MYNFNIGNRTEEWKTRIHDRFTLSIDWLISIKIKSCSSPINLSSNQKSLFAGKNPSNYFVIIRLRCIDGTAVYNSTCLCPTKKKNCAPHQFANYCGPIKFQLEVKFDQENYASILDKTEDVCNLKVVLEIRKTINENNNFRNCQLCSLKSVNTKLSVPSMSAQFRI